MKSEFNQNSAKQIPDFVRKLLTMMSSYPNIIDFSQDGSELVITDKQIFTDIVLKENFRHRNWRSFIRQLNMYNFRKINRGIGKEIFANPLFQKGNQSNFYKIRRKINIREEEEKYQKILEQELQTLTRTNYSKLPSLSIFMKTIFNFKSQGQDIIHGIKQSLDLLGQKRKCKETKPFVQEMKESFQMIDEASQKFLHSIENFSKNTELQFPKISSSFSLPSNDNSFSTQGTILIPASRSCSFSKESLELTSAKNFKEEERISKSYSDLGVTPNCSFSSVTNIFS